MSGYYYGDTWIGDEFQAGLDAMEARQDSNNGHSRRYWSLMLRVEELVFNHLPQNVL